MPEHFEGPEPGVDFALTGSAVLDKAQCDPFWYVCRLKTGESFQFEYASVSDGWVHFVNLQHLHGFPEPQRAVNPEIDRGLDVRVDMIAWILDGTS